MLNLNKPSTQEFSFEDPWKILIYDEFCRDVISPILKVGDVRKQGITLHLYHFNCCFNFNFHFIFAKTIKFRATTDSRSTCYLFCNANWRKYQTDLRSKIIAQCNHSNIEIFEGCKKPSLWPILSKFCF